MVTPAAYAEFEALAELLIEDLGTWPPDAWLVIDDAQYLVEAGDFIESVVRQAPINVLLCTRQRPAWIAARDLLYGDVLEIGRHTLAMTHDEAAEVLRDTTASSGVVALAEGWPAVVGLASLALAPAVQVDVGSGHELPEELYAFLAEELYQALPVDVREGMCLLAVAGVRSRELLVELFPRERGTRILSRAVDAGWFTDGESGLELHPLMEAFLKEKLDSTLVERTRPDAQRAADVLIIAGRWDEAFRLIARYDLHHALPDLLRGAFEEALSAGNLKSLSTWVHYAELNLLSYPEVTLASAELLFREGSFYESEVLALQAAERLSTSDRWISRAYSTAGRAAHAANREEEAVSHYRLARASAGSDADLYVAALGELTAAIDLELPEAPDLLERLKPGPEDLEGLVVYVSRWLGLHTRFGTVGDLSEPRRVYRLLHHVRDPIKRCSYRNTYGYAVASAGDVTETRLVVSEQLEDANRYRLDFIVPYARLIEAVADMICGRLADVARTVDEVEAAGRAANDDLLIANAIAIRTRCLISQGRFRDAIGDSLRWSGAVTASMQGELMGSRALALACAGEGTRALQTAEAALAVTKAVEARVTSAAAQAIVAITRADPNAFESAREAFTLSIRHHCLECFLSAYRGYPQIAQLLLGSDETREDMLRTLTIAGDLDALAAIARQSLGTSGSWGDLSPREQEVLGLVADGHSNREIGRMLFIAEATVKVHVGHILEKLDVRSRTAAALRVPAHARSKQHLDRRPESADHQ